jgi:hypothetical protein
MFEPISDEQCQRAASLKTKHGSERAAAKAAGIPRTTFRRHIKRAAERGFMGFDPVLPGYEVKSTSAQMDDAGNVQKSWVKQHKESGEAFAMPAGQILKGVSALVDTEGRIRQQWIKTKSDTAAPMFIDALKAEFAAYRGRAHLVPAPKRTDRGLMNIIPIADPHIGMLAWAPQTGTDYDLKISTERLVDTSSSLISGAPRAREALIANLGDWYHANDQRNITPRSGHQLDVDGRWFKVLQAGVRTFRTIIDLALAKHEVVEVVNIPGNHDPEAACALALALGEFYARNKRVKIAFPSEIYYRRFGATLLGCAHGDKAPPGRLAMAMAVDERKAWGETAYHWIMYGHIHKDKSDTFGDVFVESFSTLADKDNHAAGGAWRSRQRLNLITLDKRDGEVSRNFINLPPPSMRRPVRSNVRSARG